MKSCVVLPAAVLLTLGTARAASLPASFLAEEKPLKKTLVAGDMVTAELYGNDTCGGVPLASQSLAIEAVEVRERVKPFRVKKDPVKPQNGVRLHFVFGFGSPPAGDLYLQVTSAMPGAVVGIPNDCQPQAPAGGGGGATGGDQPHQNRSPFLGLQCLIATDPAIHAYPSRSGLSCGETSCLGDIRWTAINFVPGGWTECDGRLLDVSGNAALFSLLGTTYGGDGRTTFALPDMRGRSPVHRGAGPGLSSIRLGDRGGAETHRLTVGELPSHTHP